MIVLGLTVKTAALKSQPKNMSAKAMFDDSFDINLMYSTFEFSVFNITKLTMITVELSNVLSRCVESTYLQKMNLISCSPLTHP